MPMFPSMLASTALLVLLLTFLGIAESTWSIVAGDSSTGQTGVAAASCVTIPSFAEFFFYQTSYFLPSSDSVLIAQAALQTSDVLFKTAASLQQQGKTPLQVLEGIANEATDGQMDAVQGYMDYQIRQYGMVDLSSNGNGVSNIGDYASYTGAFLDEMYSGFGLDGGEQTSTGGVKGKYVYSVQANIVAKGTVAAVDQAFGDGIDLADNLMLALEAGRTTGGDIRCSQYYDTMEVSGNGNKTALVAYMVVKDKDAQEVVSLSSMTIGSAFQQDAVEELRVKYDVWRSEQSLAPSQAPTPAPALQSIPATSQQGSGATSTRIVKMEWIGMTTTTMIMMSALVGAATLVWF